LSDEKPDYEIVEERSFGHSKNVRASGWGVAIVLAAAIVVMVTQVTGETAVTNCEALSREYVGPMACVMDPICKLAPQEKADLEVLYKKMTMSCATLKFDESMALIKKEKKEADVEPTTETDPDEESARPLTE